MMKLTRLIFFTWLMVFFVALPDAGREVVAQEAHPQLQSGGEAAFVVPPVDPLGRGTPRGMVDGLVAAMARDDPRAVAEFLDLSELPEDQRRWGGRRLAAALQAVLDRSGGLLPSYRLNTAPSGSLDDGLPPDQEVFAQVRTPEGVRDLVARQVRTADGVVVWLVSPEALAIVEAQAPLTPVALVEQIMPPSWSVVRWAGAPASHWIALSAAALLSIASGLAVSMLLRFSIQRLPGGRAMAIGRAPVLASGAVLGCAFFAWASSFIGVSIVARAHVAPGVQIVAWIALATLIRLMVDGFSRLWLNALTSRGVVAAISVVTLARRGAKVLIVAAALLAAFSSLGIDLTGWLAALGIGGLVIALGAQKTVEHLVGTLSIVADKPIRIGDVCRVDGLLGTVEDIGIRSTRIRTFERTIVTIPNGIMSSARIESYATRDQFLFKHILQLRLDTPPQRLRSVLRSLDRVLADNPHVAPEPRRARLVAFGSEALNVEIFAYVVASDFEAFLAAGEELLLSLLEAVEAAGVSLAVPIRHVELYSRDGREVMSLACGPSEAPALRGMPTSKS